MANKSMCSVVPETAGTKEPKLKRDCKGFLIEMLFELGLEGGVGFISGKGTAV